MATVIEVKNLKKKFCEDLRLSMYYALKDIATEVLGTERHSDTLRKREFWALDDINFTVEQGQSVGLIGANGAGKSTLLRIISGLIKPDFGEVKVRGRVAPLIALGAGFNPILTGKENIFVNMAILGLNKHEIEERLDDVIEFSGLAHALDMPVQTYSSGMAARLGFSCAIFTEPDILLIDEVLAVGDIQFRAKCYRKLAELKKKNTTFIMVSHSAQSILSICDQALYLKRGVLKGVGSTNEVMSMYERDLSNVDDTATSTKTLQGTGKLTEGFKIESIAFVNHGNDEINRERPFTGEEATLVIDLNSNQTYDNLHVQMAFSDASLYGERVLFLSNMIDERKIKLLPGKNTVRLNFPYVGLNPGLYTLKLSIYKDELHILDTVEAFSFSVQSRFPTRQNMFYQPREWAVEHENH